MGRRRRSCIIRLFVYKCKSSPECDEREESKDAAGSKSKKKKNNIGKSRSDDDDEESGGNSNKTVAMQKRWKPELESIVEDKLLITALVEEDGDEAEEFPSPSHHLFLTSKKAMAYNHPAVLPWKAPTKRPSSTHYNKINWMYPRLFPLHSACPLGIIF